MPLMNKLRKIFNYGNFTPAAANGTSTIRVPLGGTHYTYHLRFLTAGGALITRSQMWVDVTLARVVVDGQTFIEGSGEFLSRLCDYYYAQKGLLNSNTNLQGTLTLPLALDYMPLNALSSLYAWGMSGIQYVAIEVLFAGAITTSQVQLIVERTDEPRVLGIHRRISRYVRNFASTGEISINDIPLDPSALILADHIFFADNTSGISQVIITIEGSDVITATADTTFMLNSKASRTPQIDAAANSIYSVDYGLTNDNDVGIPVTEKTQVSTANGVSDVIITKKDFRVRPTFITAAPNNFTIFRETINARS